MVNIKFDHDDTMVDTKFTIKIPWDTSIVKGDVFSFPLCSLISDIKDQHGAYIVPYLVIVLWWSW